MSAALRYCAWCRNGFLAPPPRTTPELFCGKCREEREANLAAAGWVRGLGQPGPAASTAAQNVDEMVEAEWAAGARGPTLKTCPCCWSAYDAPMWAALPLIGEQFSEDETGAYRTEMRNCPCGSTIATEEKIPCLPAR